MMKFSLGNGPVAQIQSACLVLPVVEGSEQGGHIAAVDEASGGRVSHMLETHDIKSGVGKTTLIHGMNGVAAERILFVGTGKSEKFDRVKFDKACQAAGKFLRGHAVTSAHSCLHEIAVEDLDAHWRLRQAALAFDRANYLYTTTKSLEDDSPSPIESMTFQSGPEGRAAIDEAAGLAAGYRTARELGNLPPNICTPAYLAQEALAIAKRCKRVEVEILERAEMADLGMDALLAVALGSENDPKLIVMRYQGADDPDRKPIVLVGKGVTFDTGGISLKPGPDMDQMKFDMCGAATVIGTFEACAHMQLPINVITVVGAVENMPDGKAYRPGDVITSMSGQTIEVLNTDAEGRMVLCDALTYSARFEPIALIDVATLTGACVVALGHHASAVMSKHDDLAAELVAAGQSSVDRAWRMPIWDDYQSQLDTPYADMKNVGGMPAGSLTAGCFLSRFAKDQRWAHIDIAGSAWKWGGKDGATGRPVGLLTQFLMDQT
jgi:leucyl aminopeptidase